jgi:CMP-N-acetylneuraminic acid synthetase/spore coat polysaccharide biosynthesis predicted glycosyltransferase SpsG
MSLIIAIIPARGGSKGIPRKNLRPLAGKPMIFYSISACLKAESIDQVFVSTDDEEIALFARRFGATVLMRDPKFADDLSTLDPVIINATEQAESESSVKASIIVTVQPTSPLITSEDIDGCVELFSKDKSLNSVLSVVDDRHLCWTLNEGKAMPAYDERVNRQQLKSNFRETGAVIACTRGQLAHGTRIGNNVALLEVPQMRSFDIDNFSDFYLCESILGRKKIVFAVVGYPEVGLGHAYRAIMLAHEFVQYDLVFVCEERSALAKQQIEKFNYNVISCADGELSESIMALSPDLVINDILDTKTEYINTLTGAGIRVVNFEDLGPGCKKADLVINALYPNPMPYGHIKSGAEYFCLRDEFLHRPADLDDKEIQNILITFGGVDEGDLTGRVLSILAPWCKSNSIVLTVVQGPGYAHQNTLNDTVAAFDTKWIELVNNTTRISDYMINTDIAITSGGRTVLELAALDVPMVVICQNEREQSHTFASSQNGIINLGFRQSVEDDEILSAVSSLVSDRELYRSVKNRLIEFDLTKGKQRVCDLIGSLINVGE